jgi:hypothetical protein
MSCRRIAAITILNAAVWEKDEALGLDSKRGAAMSHHQHLASVLLYLALAVVPVLSIAAAYLLGQQLHLRTRARFRPFVLSWRPENRKLVSLRL